MAVSAPPVVTGASVPRFARGMRLVDDPVRGRRVVVGPERVFELDETAMLLLERVDGVRNVDAIVDDLCAAFDGDRADEIEPDVHAFLVELVGMRVLTL